MEDKDKKEEIDKAKPLEEPSFPSKKICESFSEEKPKTEKK